MYHKILANFPNFMAETSGCRQITVHLIRNPEPGPALWHFELGSIGPTVGEEAAAEEEEEEEECR